MIITVLFSGFIYCPALVAVGSELPAPASVPLSGALVGGCELLGGGVGA